MRGQALEAMRVPIFGLAGCWVARFARAPDVRCANAPCVRLRARAVCSLRARAVCSLCERAGGRVVRVANVQGGGVVASAEAGETDTF